MAKSSAKNKVYWGTRGALFLAKDWNCVLASLETFQDMIGRRETVMLKAFTGLEGGLVGSGSTYGTVTAGAFGIALIHANVIQNKGFTA